jgi:hypothetical protein
VTTATLARNLLVGIPTPISEIAERCGCSRREVEEAAEAAAANGYPLVAGARGLWVASSADELRDYEERLRNRIRSQMRRVRGVRKARQAYEQPATLWDRVA